MKRFIYIIVFILSCFCNQSNAQITTIAGNGTLGISGNGLPATSAEFGSLLYIAIDANNYIYITDTTNTDVRVIDSNSVIHSFLDVSEVGVAVDNKMNVYLGDIFHNNIQVLIPSSSSLQYFAGIPGSCGYFGDGGPATGALLSYPSGIAIDNKGNVYFCDEHNNCIRKVDSAGIVRTVAGNDSLSTCFAPFTGCFLGDSILATRAELYNPKGIAVDNKGNVYIADFNNNLIRKVDTFGIITTFAGYDITGQGFTGDGGPAKAAQLKNPYGIVIDKTGNVYFTEYGSGRVRKVDTNGIITTIAGSMTSTVLGDGGDPLLANLNGPTGIAIDKNGDFIIEDNGNLRIRKVCSFTVPAINGGPVGTLAVCSLDTTNLTDSMTGGNWSSSDTTIAKIDDSGHISFISQGNATFYYTIHSGCFSKVAIKFNAPPSRISGASFACISNSDSTQLKDSVAGGRWISRNILKSTVSASGWLHGINAGTDTIIYILANACGIDTVSRIINVYPTLHAGIITGGTAVCTGDSVLLSDTTMGGSWNIITGNASVSDGKVKGITVGIDTVEYTVGNSCGSSTAIQVISVNPMPYTGVITGDSVICAGALTTLNDSIGGGVWTGSNGNAIVSADGIVYGFTEGTDTISYTFTNSCGVIVTTRVFTLNTLPAAGFIVGGSVVCEGAAITVTDTLQGGTWQSSDNNVASVTGGVVTGIAGGSTTISYAVSNDCGSGTATHQVTVDPLPGAGIITAITDTICPGVSVTLTDNVQGGRWSSGNNRVEIDSSGIATGVSPGSGMLFYTVSNDCGSGEVDYLLDVEPLPSLPVIGGLNIICIGDSYDTLTGDPPGGLWSGSNGSASISGGVVAGLSGGIDTISYAFSNSCGYFSSSIPVYIHTTNEYDSILGAGYESKVYPNPASEVFTVDIPQTGSSATIIVMDFYGRVINRQSVSAGTDRVSVDCSGFRRGIYQVEVITNRGIYMNKVVIL